MLYLNYCRFLFTNTFHTMTLEFYTNNRLFWSKLWFQAEIKHISEMGKRTLFEKQLLWKS